MKNEEADWEYKPEGDPQIEQAAGLTEAVDKELKKPGRSKKTESITWSASEYIDHKQGFGWYLLLSLGTVLLAAIIYLITRDYFAVGITLAAGIIVGIFAHRTPNQLDYELSADGLKIGDKMYLFSIFKSFSVIQDGALLSIDLEPIKRFMPPVTAYFAPEDQEKILAILQDHLPYHEKNLEAVERLTRRLRF